MRLPRKHLTPVGRDPNSSQEIRARFLTSRRRMRIGCGTSLVGPHYSLSLPTIGAGASDFATVWRHCSECHAPGTQTWRKPHRTQGSGLHQLGTTCHGHGHPQELNQVNRHYIKYMFR